MTKKIFLYNDDKCKLISLNDDVRYESSDSDDLKLHNEKEDAFDDSDECKMISLNDDICYESSDSDGLKSHNEKNTHAISS